MMPTNFKKRIISFKSFAKKTESFYLIISKEANKAHLETTLSFLFKESIKEIDKYEIIYIDKYNKTVNYDQLEDNNCYYVNIGKNKKNSMDFYDYDEIIKSNIITILHENDYLNAMNSTNITYLEEKLKALENLSSKEMTNIEEKNKTLISSMNNYRDKIEKQTEFYEGKQEVLFEISEEFRLIADQLEKIKFNLERTVSLNK